MTKMFLVVRNEVISIILRWSFLVMVIIVPLFYHWVTFLVSLSQPKTATAQIFADLLNSSPEPKQEGFVDYSGLVHSIPEEFIDKLVRFESEEQARIALKEGKITAYTLIPKDYLEQGRIIQVRPDIALARNSVVVDPVTQVLIFNLLGEDEQSFQRYLNPMELSTQYLVEPPAIEPKGMTVMLIPYLTMGVMLFAIYGSATVMLGTFVDEHKNRVLEILLTSTSPHQLLVGKIIGVGLVGAIQLAGWGMVFFLFNQVNPYSLRFPFEVNFMTTRLLVWGIIFFILGYALYAFLIAGVGALVPNLQEVNQFTTLVIAPLLITLLLFALFSHDPNGGLAVFLSLFPFTSPMAMVARLSVTDVPTWQLFLTSLLLAGAILWVIRIVSAMFRTQNLLSGQKLDWKVFLQSLTRRGQP